MFRRACARFATGVTVATTRAADGSAHGLTVNAFSSISLDPPMVMIAIDRASSVLRVFETSGYHAVNILRDDQRELSVRFSELPEGRFSGVDWHPGAATGAPVIAGVLGVLECRTVQVVEAGEHRIFIGEVVEASESEGRPLVFYDSEYTEIR